MSAPDERTVTWNGQRPPVLARLYRARRERWVGATLVLAHGAGAGLAHPFMVTVCESLSVRGVDVVAFDFPYMAAGRRVPDPAAVLESCYLGVLDDVKRWTDVDEQPRFLGGKSLGGRMASHLAAYHADRVGPLGGLVFLGYPLHPPKRPQYRRDTHLAAIGVPMLFVQGSRDPFGTPDELRPLLRSLQAPADLVVVEGGDHSFVVPRRAGGSRDEALTRVADEVAGWIRARSRSRSGRP